MDEFEQKVLEGITDLRERMSAIETKVTGREEVCQLHRADMLSIKADINGNGKPGLKNLVADLKTDLRVYKAKLATWAAAGGMVGGGLMFAITNWETIVKIVRGH